METKKSFRGVYLERVSDMVSEKTHEEKSCKIADMLSKCTSQSETMLHVKIIYGYINPHNKNTQSDLFLNLFVTNVLGLTSKEIGNITSVERKNSIENISDIDIIIESDFYIIGLKMKIYVGDQDISPEKCYSELSKRNANQNKTILLYYLANDGNTSTKVGLEFDKCKIVQISFENHIINWLELCQDKIRNNISIYNHLNDYLLHMFLITGQFDRLSLLQKELL